jgi:predicted patatin/cPLA2 family phospholipase
MKTGLVLEGGAMRGIYTAGVLDVLAENNLIPDGVIGVSAGAVHGCSFVSGQTGRSIRYYMKYCRDWRFMSVKSFLKTGDVVHEQFCYHDLPESLDPFDNDAFERSPMDFYAVSSNLTTGKALYQLLPSVRGKKIDYIRASASMPLVSRIVEIEGKKLLDGGVCDSIPLKAFQELGYEKNIVVLTRPEGYVKKPADVTLAKKLYKDYPLFVQAMANRHIHYNDTLSYIKEQEQTGNVLVIRPSKDLHIKRMDRNPLHVKAQYELGRKDALHKLKELQRFFDV